LTVVGGRMLYFIVGNNQLWRSDGTEEGTEQVLAPLYSPGELTAVGDQLFFVNDNRLYRTDGTLAGTFPLTLQNAGKLTSAGGVLYFTGIDPADGDGGRDLWRSDGTAAGTVRVADVSIETSSSPYGGQLASFDGRLYFPNDDGVHGVELWAIDLPPAVRSMAIGDGSASRSQVKQLAVHFDRPVTISAGGVRLALLNTGGSGRNDGSAPTDVSEALDSPITPDGGRTWVFTFAAGSGFLQKDSTGASKGSLADGVYTLSIDPAKVAANGIAMVAPATLTFHRLFGDVNGNGNVNAADYNAFRGAFGKRSEDPAYNAAFDFDGDGSINALDYNQFRNRFGKSFTY
jgi:ELWxxDGT repeat protein